MLSSYTPERKSDNLSNKDLHAFLNDRVTFHGLEKNPVIEIETLQVERKPQPVPTGEVVKLLFGADRHNRK